MLLKKACNDLKHNPYKTGQSLLDPKCFVSLKADQANLDQHKASSLNDQSYNVPLGQLEGLPPQPQLIKMFKKGCFSYDDFLSLLSSRRNASASGLNGISYKVYKKCSKLSKFLFQILKFAFSEGEIPLQWQSAREIYILKLKTPSENSVSDFRPIALLNCSFLLLIFVCFYSSCCLIFVYYYLLCIFLLYIIYYYYLFFPYRMGSGL